MYRAAFAGSQCLLNLNHRFRVLGAIASGQTWTKARWRRRLRVAGIGAIVGALTRKD